MRRTGRVWNGGWGGGGFSSVPGSIVSKCPSVAQRRKLGIEGRAEEVIACVPAQTAIDPLGPAKPAGKRQRNGGPAFLTQSGGYLHTLPIQKQLLSPSSGSGGRLPTDHCTHGTSVRKSDDASVSVFRELPEG